MFVILLLDASITPIPAGFKIKLPESVLIVFPLILMLSTCRLYKDPICVRPAAVVMLVFKAVSEIRSTPLTLIEDPDGILIPSVKFQ